MANVHRISALILGLSLAAGCSKSSPDTAAPEPDDAAEPGVTAAARPMRVTGVHLDPALVAVCELEAGDALVEFDRDARSEEVDQVLTAVATCVKTGPLQGRRLEIVGHAAPRGDEYRSTYGKSRADTIRGCLLADGVKDEDLVTHPTDPEDDLEAASEWPTERRVDIRVATRHAH